MPQTSPINWITISLAIFLLTNTLLSTNGTYINLYSMITINLINNINNKWPW